MSDRITHATGWARYIPGINVGTGALKFFSGIGGICSKRIDRKLHQVSIETLLAMRETPPSLPLGPKSVNPRTVLRLDRNLHLACEGFIEAVPLIGNLFAFIVDKVHKNRHEKSIELCCEAFKVDESEMPSFEKIEGSIKPFQPYKISSFQLLQMKLRPIEELPIPNSEETIDIGLISHRTPSGVKQKYIGSILAYTPSSDGGGISGHYIIVRIPGRDYKLD